MQHIEDWTHRIAWSTLDIGRITSRCDVASTLSAPRAYIPTFLKKTEVSIADTNSQPE